MELLEPTWAGSDSDSWGIDHGTLVVLAHVFPEADVPVGQLSANATKPLEYHLDLGRQLAPLRDEGILIVGSGNVVHNLHRVERNQPDRAYDWARPFNEQVIQVMTSTPGDILSVIDDGDYSLAIPTANLQQGGIQSREPRPPLPGL